MLAAEEAEPGGAAGRSKPDSDEKSLERYEPNTDACAEPNY